MEKKTGVRRGANACVNRFVAPTYCYWPSAACAAARRATGTR